MKVTIFNFLFLLHHLFSGLMIASSSSSASLHSSSPITSTTPTTACATTASKNSTTIVMSSSNNNNNNNNSSSTTTSTSGMMTPKRSSYLPWKPYFLAMAKLSSQRSKDPQNQVGACIVDDQNRIVGIGYNGFPRKCSDDVLPWSSITSTSTSTTKSDDNHKSLLHHKEWFMVHAEVNAILNKIGNVQGTTMYVYGSFPCNECAKLIIQAGIKEIVYIEKCHNKNSYSTCSTHDRSHDTINQIKASKILFQLAGVKVTKYVDDEHQLLDKIPDLEFQVQPDTTNNNTKEHSTTTSGSSSSSSSSSGSDSNIPEEHRNLLINEANYDPLLKANHDLKRSNHLSWNDYFMSVASLSAYRSKDPNTQVGACIVDSNKCIIGIGYNGFPRGCSDDHLPWSRTADNPLMTKYFYVVHAEVNAILNKGSKDCTGATIYVDLFPCNDCAKIIIQSGIKEVVYCRDTYHDTDGCRASRIMFEMAGVRCKQYHPTVKSVNVDIFDR